MLCMMLDPHYKGLGLVIQFVGKERALQITIEYGCALGWGSSFFPHIIVIAPPSLADL